MSDTCRVHQPYQKSLWDHTALPGGWDATVQSDGMSPSVATTSLWCPVINSGYLL